MDTRSNTNSFFERQSFRQWWLWTILLGIAALFIYRLIQQFYFGLPSRPGFSLVFFSVRRQLSCLSSSEPPSSLPVASSGSASAGPSRPSGFGSSTFFSSLRIVGVASLAQPFLRVFRNSKSVLVPRPLQSVCTLVFDWCLPRPAAPLAAAPFQRDR